MAIKALSLLLCLVLLAGRHSSDFAEDRAYLKVPLFFKSGKGLQEWSKSHYIVPVVKEVRLDGKNVWLAGGNNGSGIVIMDVFVYLEEGDRLVLHGAAVHRLGVMRLRADQSHRSLRIAYAQDRSIDEFSF